MYTRDEIEAAFTRFQAAAEESVANGDWTPWSECFTEDAQYYEHHYGRYEGRAAILDWISTTMAEPINRDMVAFPVDWYVIDEARGWVLCAIWNQMADPGDGKFDYEEDMYNPAEFAAMIKGWLAAKKRLAGS